MSQKSKLNTEEKVEIIRKYQQGGNKLSSSGSGCGGWDNDNL